MSDNRDRLLKLARSVATGRSSTPAPGEAQPLNPTVVKAVRTGGAVLLGSAILRRSRLARLAVAGGAVAYAGRRRAARGDGWEDVPPPDDVPR